ncbi:F-type H+-transporting ATPase subunit delta [Arcanobacterium pluranimalium]|uniref:F0F1 ATP synthase subunit delta n=1 Tax=Arcanobacterium pluranimalium TaxID=108028 RepID=UPI00195B77F7|nr:F0F1 ATP synthase subunit delta [Arcanobacterium pluranimalium]MBM7825835.1 F-type H+-transporting ATPase subunit delta [Arcanobacterium pluranimalium]
MRSKSEAALARITEAWDALLREQQTSTVDFGEEIFNLADVMQENPSVLAALEDASRDIEDRIGLAERLFHGKVSSQVLDLLKGLVRERWAQDGDLLLALESIGIQTLLASAEKEDLLSKTEEELYQCLRTLKQERELRLTLNSTQHSVAARAQLIRKVFARVNPYTLALLVRAVAHTKQFSLTAVIARYIDQASERGKHLVASVTAAIPLSTEQEERLRSILCRYYNQDVKLHIALDPTIVGGLRIHIGDDLIDGTLASRIADVKEVFSK